MIFIEKILESIEKNAPDLGGRALVALLIFSAAIVAGRLVARGAERVLSRRHETITLGPVTASLAKILILGAGTITALSQIGIDVTAVLAGAGVVGLAVGFGAQTLVKDLLSGFFLIFDGVLTVGDSVKMDSIEGVVEAVGLRMTRIRAFNGRVWFVPNGSISVVGNSSRDWGRAVVEVGIGYGSDVAKALKILRDVGEQWSKENRAVVIEGPQAQGLLSLDDSSIRVRLFLKVRPADVFACEIEIRRLVKEAFEKAQIEIPFPTRTVLSPHSSPASI